MAAAGKRLVPPLLLEVCAPCFSLSQPIQNAHGLEMTTTREAAGFRCGVSRFSSCPRTGRGALFRQHNSAPVNRRGDHWQPMPV